MPSATEALTGPTRHATIPKMVATGAAGAATALATTAQRGMMGLSRIRIGWHAICAASGTASTRARPEGMNRESFVVTGPVSNKIPPVATTERAKAKSKASHGSSARRTKTVTPNTGIPRTGLAEATHTNTIEAMMEALMMLGSGVTKTTKPTSARTPATMRTHSPPPKRATRATTKATTMAQLAPDTATK